jgi:multiple sugar transport system permease protein
VLLIGLTVFPFGLSLYVSLTNWQPQFGNWWQASFIGLGNYVDLFFGEPRFVAAVARTLTISAIGLTLEFGLGLLLAVSLAPVFRAKRGVISVLLAPMMTMPVVVGYTFFLLFQREGPMTALFGWALGSGQVDWLANPNLAFLAIIVMEVWHWTPLFMLILLSGLTSLPQNPIRAGMVLGASRWQIFRFIELPMLKPLILVAFVIRGMEVIKLFDEIFVMTRGGPGTSTETISTYLRQLAFANFQLGFAAAAAAVVLIVTVVVVFWALRPIRYRLEEGG